jgi:hydrogenase maturation protein HypF
VEIEIYGSCSRLKLFQKALLTDKPPLAKIEEIRVYHLNGSPPPLFTVFESRAETRETLIPPDVAICRDCLSELFYPRDRRWHYPFINCTNCGPRFTVIEDLPYDREKTTLKVFPMCAECLAEYSDPLSRRFHAEPNACPRCGPRIWLTDSSGKSITEEPLKGAIEALRQGKILALRGLGGFHLAVDALSEKAVQLLRKRKRRPCKPLAIMVPDLETAESLVFLSQAQKEALVSFWAPIVLAPRKPSNLAPSLAPGIDDLGIMLP